MHRQFIITVRTRQRDHFLKGNASLHLTHRHFAIHCIQYLKSQLPFNAGLPLQHPGLFHLYIRLFFHDGQRIWLGIRHIEITVKSNLPVLPAVAFIHVHTLCYQSQFHFLLVLLITLSGVSLDLPWTALSLH